MKTSAFTLIELLVVIAIIAILAAILFPVFLAARAAAYQWNANSALNEIDSASLMYLNDFDDTYPLAMYTSKAGAQAWFGLRTGATPFDNTKGLLYPYEKSNKLRDPVFQGKEYLGDHSGYGYNWGYIGSDFHITRNYSTFPQCANAATGTNISYPSRTVVFATSAYYSVPWAGGDGQVYDFGFIDPVGFRPGNPNVDFRHIQPRQVNLISHTISYPGNAIVAFSDGHTRAYKIGQLKDYMFQRDAGGAGIDTNGY